MKSFTPLRGFTPQELILREKSALSSVYVETFIYEPAQVNELSLGQLYIAAEISSNKTKKESARILTELVNILKNEYYRRLNLTALASLKFALKKTNDFLKQMPFAEKEKIITANIIVAARMDEKLHLAKIGLADALIVRQENIYNVFPWPALKIKNKDESFQSAASGINLKFENITSGQLEKKDMIFLISQKLIPTDFDCLKNYLNSNLSVRPKNLASLDLNLKNLAAIVLRPAPALTPNPPQQKNKTDKTYKSYRSYLSKKKTIIVLSLIVIAAGFTIFSALELKKQAVANKKEAETLLREITDLKEKIAVVIALGNDDEANNLLTQTQSKMERLVQLNYFKTTRASLQEEISRLSQKLSHTEAINSLSQAVSLENNSLNFDPLNVVLGQNKIFVLGENNFYQFDANRKEGSFNDAAAGALGNKIISLIENPKEKDQIFLAGENKLISFSPSTQTVQELWQTPLVRLGGLTGQKQDQTSPLKQAVFYNETFYILTVDNLIYKLSLPALSENNLAATSSPDVRLSLWLDKNEISEPLYQIAIDGFVYALSGRHKVFKLLNGSTKETFDFTENIDQIFTEASFDNLYLLSRESGLIIIFDKNKKTVVKRLGHSELKSAKSFYVNSQERIIYFLKDKTVYSFEL